ncbi:DUF3284 domain-containing protein [Lactiplantibacillus nangangensis]|uniref:DUF3284 domain-containing protein n=1 Tax=Lactiplantibacillus nangangensis TaxID=2559917 RepID=A0ABW1SGS6_9LACO|nr:DUF3284 domain-containing protein [Lactiplantibacillus nangangensis]
MKIVRTLDIAVLDFYDYLEKQLITEIYENTHRRISANEIKKGLRYRKRNIKAKADVLIIIEDYQRGKVYQVTTKTPLETITVSYQTASIGPKQVRVTLLENILSYEPQKHTKLLCWWSQAIMLGQMSKTVLELEEKIKKWKDITML